MYHPGLNDILGFGMVGGLAAYFKAIPMAIWSKGKSYLTITLEIPNTTEDKTEIICWLENWLETKRSIKHRNLKASNIWDNSDSKVDYNLSPDAHYYPFWTKYKKTKVLVRCFKRDTQKGSVLYDYSIYFFTRNNTIIKDFLDEIQEDYNNKFSQKVFIRTWSSYEWNKGKQIKQRSLDSVILPSGQLNAIKTDIDFFCKSTEMYEKAGVIHKRGYLFEGLAGTGKSSLARAIASYLKWNLYVFSPETDKIGGGITKSFSEIRSKSVVLIEDIDTFNIKRTEEDTQDANNKTGSWLNFLDGIGSPDDCIFILTTNYPDRLDPALLRNGRVDFTLNFSYATEDQIKQAYLNFKAEANQVEIDEFYFKYKDRQVVMAEVQHDLFQQFSFANKGSENDKDSI